MLHLIEHMALENVAKESRVGFVKAFQVILEHHILTFKDLHLTQSELSVQAKLNIVKVEYFSANLLNIQFLDKLIQVVLVYHQRVGIRP